MGWTAMVTINILSSPANFKKRAVISKHFLRNHLEPLQIIIQWLCIENSLWPTVNPVNQIGNQRKPEHFNRVMKCQYVSYSHKHKQKHRHAHIHAHIRTPWANRQCFNLSITDHWQVLCGFFFFTQSHEDFELNRNLRSWRHVSLQMHNVRAQ